MAALQSLLGSQPGHLLLLERDSVVLGRHPDCDIVLESAAVSRQHARILRIEGAYYVEDLHSRNGTFVNDQPVLDRRLLSENDDLRICDLVFVFHQGPPRLRVRSTEREESDPHGTAMLVDDERPTTKSEIMSKVDISSGSSSLQLQLNTEAKLKALIEISQRLGKALGLSEVLPGLLDCLFRIFVQADRGFIVLKDPRSGRLVPKAVKHRRSEGMETIRISRTIVNSVMATKEAILSADAATDSRFDMAESIVDFQIRSMMCAPLIGSEGDALGVIQIDTRDQRQRFSREDLDVLASVACQAAFAVENAQLHEAALRQQALARELVLAHEVQRSLLPAASPQIGRYAFFEFYEPANELGGDYYDYVQLPDGRLGVIVADVSGKGISAALVVARFSAEARFCLATEATPAAAIGRLNQVFCGRGWEDRFVTLVLCVLDPARHEVTIVNAGHMPPLLRQAPATIRTVAEAEARLPLGVDPNVIYPQCVVPLAAGDCLTLYTDGITEAMNDADELYGPHRLWSQLAGNAPGVTAVGRRILDDVRSFVGTRRQSDDMCLVCFGRTDQA
jgi:serine phosphatase RsbU (regulator of sigma subunit)/pSer/pThr/pTyr-binding forkhead associated (FHA) protein